MSVFTDITKVVLVYIFIISGPLLLVYNESNKVCPRTGESTPACTEFSQNLDNIGKILILLSFITTLSVF
jgi:hypothetical protein